jgi:uncharacterized protein YqhQ
MPRVEKFRKEKEAQGSGLEKAFWILFIVICLVLGAVWKKEAFVFLIIPVVRAMFFNWKKENEYINSE